MPRSRAVSIVATFLCVMVGWVFFRAESLSAAVRILGAMAGLHGVETYATAMGAAATPYLLWLVAGMATVFALPNTWELRYPRTVAAAAWLAVLFTLCVLRLGAPSPFIYYQF